MLKFTYRAFAFDTDNRLRPGVKEEILAENIRTARRKAWARAVKHLEPLDGEAICMEWVREGSMEDMSKYST